MNSTEVVVINWKRPLNVARIVAALKAQSEPCTITVCDCHPSRDFELDDETLTLVDRLYRWTHNCGAYSRYVPVGAYDHQFTLFLDDDMLPGIRCVEHFVRNAKRGNFGVLGQIGRIILPDGIYCPRDVCRSENFLKTDIIIRGYFVSTKNLYNVQRLRWMLNYFDEALPEDDLLLCTSMLVCADLASYLTPWDADEETLINKQELSTEHALSKRPDHFRKREEFIRRVMRFGWKPLYASDSSEGLSAPF